MLEDLISFDICGKIAHFRKFYSNSSALTHSIPPRTTIIGIIGAIIGEPRDSYYVSLDDLLIGIQVRTKGRKIFQKFNYLKVESGNIDLYAGIAENRTQTSVELIIPDNIRDSDLCYRIFVGTVNGNHPKYLMLKEHLKADLCEFGISLGSAHLLGYVKNFKSYNNFCFVNESTVELSTAVLVEQVKSIKNNEINLEQDIFPLRMKINSSSMDKNKTRIASDVRPMLFSIDGSCFTVDLCNSTNIFKLKDGNCIITIALV